MLSHQIDSDLFARQGEALTSFSRTLPAAEQSELAQALIKDPYSFDFLPLGSDAELLERDLERGLIEHLRLAPQARRHARSANASPLPYPIRRRDHERLLPAPSPSDRSRRLSTVRNRPKSKCPRRSITFAARQERPCERGKSSTVWP